MNVIYNYCVFCFKKMFQKFVDKKKSCIFAPHLRNGAIAQLVRAHDS